MLLDNWPLLLEEEETGQPAPSGGGRLVISNLRTPEDRHGTATVTLTPTRSRVDPLDGDACLETRLTHTRAALGPVDADSPLTVTLTPTTVDLAGRPLPAPTISRERTTRLHPTHTTIAGHVVADTALANAEDEEDTAMLAWLLLR